MRCAPRELALAEANLNFALADLAQGSSYTARGEIREAETAIKRAMTLSKDCGQKRILVREKEKEPEPKKPPPVVVMIEQTDVDRDGIFDKDDKCPDQPEDKDGFEDSDGCPDPDNDHDRIPDVSDKCPNEPETYNGVKDDDGCPDQGLVTTNKGKIVTMKPIYFETDKDIIKPESFPVVDAVAAAINGNPWIEQVEIQGHADERGDDAHNLDLTERRAASVRRALEERNVLPSKLRSHGYGETKPICKEHNEACWSKTRRVEFIIEKPSGQGGAKFQGGEGQ